MKPTFRTFLRITLSLLLVTGAMCGFTACSAHDTAHRQQGITDAHDDMIQRREARQAARDERFSASRESWMN